MPAKTQRTTKRTTPQPRRRPLTAAPAAPAVPARRRERGADSFPAERLEAAVARAGMAYPTHIIGALAAAIDSGKHVILTGPPGTGKTTLAYMAADAAQTTMLCSGY